MPDTKTILQTMAIAAGTLVVLECVAVVVPALDWRQIPNAFASMLAPKPKPATETPPATTEAAVA